MNNKTEQSATKLLCATVAAPCTSICASAVPYRRSDAWQVLLKIPKSWQALLGKTQTNSTVHLSSFCCCFSSLAWRRRSIKSTCVFVSSFVVHWWVQFPRSFPNSSTVHLSSLCCSLSSLTWRRLGVESACVFVSSFVVHWWAQFPSSFPNLYWMVKQMEHVLTLMGRAGW